MRIIHPAPEPQIILEAGDVAKYDGRLFLVLEIVGRTNVSAIYFNAKTEAAHLSDNLKVIDGTWPVFVLDVEAETWRTVTHTDGYRDQ